MLNQTRSGPLHPAPEPTFMRSAANGSKEPIVQNAALRTADCLADVADLRGARDVASQTQSSGGEWIINRSFETDRTQFGSARATEISNLKKLGFGLEKYPHLC
jgi:hypothetical protein